MGVSGQRHAPAALLPPVPIVQEAGWAPELQEKSFAPAGDRDMLGTCINHIILFDSIPYNIS
jgi:hypothetical protein